jgi:prepilin-type N-terminal cleavage/methylation domain-containing protein
MSSMRWSQNSDREKHDGHDRPSEGRGSRNGRSPFGLSSFAFSLSREGFTLIEMVAVIIILSIISAITIYFLVNSAKQYAVMMNQRVLFEEAQLAMERMCREIRDAKAILSPSGGVSASSIVFTRTHSTACDSANETITFRLTGTTLEKVKTSPSAVSPLAERVSTFSVTRGATDDEIKIVLGLSLVTGENMTLQTKVYPKNLPKSTTHKHFFENWAEEIST